MARAKQLCPRCGKHPPRWPLAAVGRVPICAPCRRVVWRAKYARRLARRVPDDIPPEEIERRYHLALLQIRRRAS